MRPQRLHRRIFRSLLAVALVAIVATAITSHMLEVERIRSPLAARLQAEAQLVARGLPEQLTSGPELQAALTEQARALSLDAAVLDGSGRVLATSQQGFPGYRWRRHPGGTHFSRARASLQLALPDGGLLLVRPSHAPGRHLLFFPVLIVLVLALVVGSRKVARRITRRLESLEKGVEELGGGALETRVPVEGSDEVASLARTFNRAADRIERLVGAQRRVLASASHELRSPLARLRLVLELLRERCGTSVPGSDEVERRIAEGIEDVEELDALVEDLLLASRLEAEQPPSFDERVELLALVQSEAERFGVPARGQPAQLPGSARLLRRLVRNLLDNARRHAGGQDIEAGVETGPGEVVRLWVADRGPGVPEDQRDRIFEPFHRAAASEAEGQGVGLGLDLVRRIARHHGGEVRYRERPGGGALFEVSFPASGVQTE